MAVDAQIDKLRIDIETNITSDPKRIDEIYESLKRLKSITEEKWSGLDEIVNKINKLGQISQTPFTQFSSNLQLATANISPLSAAMETQSSILSTNLTQALKNYNEEAAKIGDTQFKSEDLVYFEKELRKVIAQTATFNNQINSLSKDIDFAGKAAIKGSSGFDKLVLSIKRITFYRVVRRAIQLIGREITNSIKNFVLFDDATNEAISGLMSSWKAMSNAFAVVFSQLINTAAPLLIKILDLATNVANAISLIFATISGEEVYSKAIKNEENYRDALEETNKQLLGFDRFNVLQGQDIKPMFETEDVATGWANASDETKIFRNILEDIIPILDGIIQLVKDLGKELYPLIKESIPVILGTIKELLPFIISIVKELMPIITTIINELIPIIKELMPLLSTIVDLIVALKPVIKFIVDIIVVGLQSITPALQATISILNFIIKVVTAIINTIDILINGIINGFDNVGESLKNIWQGIGTAFANMINGIANGFIKFVNVIIDLINTVLEGLGMLFGRDVKIPHWEATVNWQPFSAQYYARGGIPDTRGGSLWITGEDKKPELVYENNRGQTQVSNQQSIEGAMLNALRQHTMETQGSSQATEVIVRFDADGNALIRALRPYVRNESVRAGSI